MGSPRVDKKCGKCGIWKPVSEFYPSKRGTRGRDGYCKDCRRILDRERADARNKAVQAMKAKDPFYYRNKKLIKMYGITQEQYESLCRLQNGVCAICGNPEKRVLYGGLAYLSVDHDHTTGKIRSLLCHLCNSALGVIENAEFLTKALAYLESHK